MARMRGKRFPESERDNPRYAAEYKLWQGFENQLPEDYCVVRGIAWLGKDRDGRLTDGETDFAILHPDKGILLIEVKGGKIGYDPETDRWTSRDRNGVVHNIKDPLHQVRQAKHNFLKKLKSLPGWENKWLDIGHAVSFPDCSAQKGYFAPDLEREIMILADDLDSLRSKIDNIFVNWEQETGGKRSLSPEDIEKAIHVFAPSINLPQPLGVFLREDDREIIKLTEQQFAILNSLCRLRRVSVPGGAGTGKTVLALETALRLAAEGLSVLLTCYNRPLADFLEQSVITRPESSPSLHVRNFHRLCDEEAAAAGLDLKMEPGGEEHYFNTQMPEGLMRALDARPGRRFDAVIVDEGQDFCESWWLPLQCCLRNPDDDILFVFHDDNQRIYNRDTSHIPERLTPFPLTRNLRNSKAICSLIRQFYYGEEIEAVGPNGIPVEYIPVDSPPDLRKELSRLLHRLVREEGVDSRDIEVLSGHSLDHSVLDQAEAIGAFRLGQPKVGENSSLVYFESIGRFKGLERLVVILVEIDHLVWNEEVERLYVGTSRARGHLAIIGQGPTLTRIQEGVESPESTT